MDIVVKISRDYTAATTEAQFINPAGLSFSDELVNTGEMNFTLSLLDNQIGSIVEFRKVALYAIEQGEDRLLWTGYIDDPVNDETYVRIKCGDEKDFLRRKMNLGLADWTSTDIQTALTSLLAQVNGRRGPNEGLLTFSTDVGTTNINKKFDDGTSVFDIIKEICEKLKLEWKVVFNQIIIQTTIGVDRSIPGSNYEQFIWNIDSPNENNITRFNNSRKSKEIATFVLGKNTSGISVITGDLTEFGSIESAVTVADGDVAVQTQEYINKHQFTQIERDLDVIVDDQDARIIMVGDSIPVKFIHGSALVDANETLKIIQRKFVFQNKKPTVTINVAKASKEVASEQNFLADLNRRLKRIEL